MTLPTDWQPPVYTKWDKAKDKYITFYVNNAFEDGGDGPLTMYESDTGATVNTSEGDQLEQEAQKQASSNWDQALLYYNNQRNFFKSQEKAMHETELDYSSPDEYAYNGLSSCSSCEDAEFLADTFYSLYVGTDDVK
jgi:hypothetical protein